MSAAIQTHTLRLAPAAHGKPEREIVIGVAARAFSAEGEARRLWAQLRDRSVGKNVSVARAHELTGTRQLVIVAGDPRHVTQLTARLSAGTPHTLSADELEAIALNRVRHGFESGDPRRADIVIRRPAQRGVFLHRDCTTSPVSRPQG
jgi:hypothetical protein